MPYSPRTWWKFAINSTLHHVREKNRRRTKSYMVQRVHDLLLYREAYMQQLQVGAYYLDYKYKVCFTF